MYFKYFLQALIGWTLAAPLSVLIPKQSNLIVFIGRDEGRFIDNVKYMYLYLRQHNCDGFEYYFLTENSQTHDILASNDLPVLRYPSARSIIKLLRARVVFVDNWMWILNVRYHLLLNSKIVQLWHGIPLKKIEHENPVEHSAMSSPIGWIKNTLGGRFPVYDDLISTSSHFTQNVFSKSIKPKAVLESGYPRNDVLFREPEERDLLWADKKTLEKVKELREDGHKIVLYCPTFRDTGGDAIVDNALDLERLSEFASNNGIRFVFKFHPNSDCATTLERTENILMYDNVCDVYPMLRLTDLLVTDYSSIYFDYLLLNRPIVFFPYDFEKYTGKDRELNFEYSTVVPGPKCMTQESLLAEIRSILINDNDLYREKREAVLNIAFDHKDGRSSERIWEYLRNKYFQSHSGHV